MNRKRKEVSTLCKNSLQSRKVKVELLLRQNVKRLRPGSFLYFFALSLFHRWIVNIRRDMLLYSAADEGNEKKGDEKNNHQCLIVKEREEGGH